MNGYILLVGLLLIAVGASGNEEQNPNTKRILGKIMIGIGIIVIIISFTMGGMDNDPLIPAGNQ